MDGITLINLLRGIVGLGLVLSLVMPFVYCWRRKSGVHAVAYSALTLLLSTTAFLFIETYAEVGHIDPFFLIALFLFKASLRPIFTHYLWLVLVYRANTKEIQ